MSLPKDKLILQTGKSIAKRFLESLWSKEIRKRRACGFHCKASLRKQSLWCQCSGSEGSPCPVTECTWADCTKCWALLWKLQTVFSCSMDRTYRPSIFIKLCMSHDGHRKTFFHGVNYKTEERLKNLESGGGDTSPQEKERSNKKVGDDAKPLQHSPLASPHRCWAVITLKFLWVSSLLKFLVSVWNCFLT